MKLTTVVQTTLDGVVQGNGGASEEDRRTGFERGGRARGKRDAGTRAFIDETDERADAFLLGRRTCDLFAASWGTLAEAGFPGSEPVQRALNAGPSTWSRRRSRIRAGRARPRCPGPPSRASRPRPVVHGGGALVRWLPANDLVDDLTLIVVPVVVGQVRGCSRRTARTSRSTCSSRAPDAPPRRADRQGASVLIGTITWAHDLGSTSSARRPACSGNGC